MVAIRRMIISSTEKNIFVCITIFHRNMLQFNLMEFFLHSRSAFLHSRFYKLNNPLLHQCQYKSLSADNLSRDHYSANNIPRDHLSENAMKCFFRYASGNYSYSDIKQSVSLA